jgi:uncharacterized protein
MKYSQFNSLIPYQGKYALYNSYENKVIFLDSHLKEILDAAKNEGVNELDNVHPDFYNYLTENNFIVDSNFDEIEKVRVKTKIVDENETSFLLTVNPTMNCNFKCWYCYETHIKDSKLEYSVLDAIKLFINKTLSKEKINFFSLSFFGGEPLLYFKKNVIPLIDHLQIESIKSSKLFSITFTTNGYLVNEDFINYFKAKNIHAHLQITLDGYREEHDKVRFVSKTKGSYSEIVNNIKKLLMNNNFLVTLRINFTSESIHNCFKIVDDFEDIPLYIRKNKLLIDFHRVWQDGQLDGTNLYLDENIEKIKEKGFVTNAIYSADNVANSCYADKRNSATINYNGDLYKCTARDFLTENRVGYLTEEGDLIWENDHLNKRMDSKFQNKPCLSCKIMPLCNGGCSQHALEHLEKGTEYCVFSGDEGEKDKVVTTKIQSILDGIVQEA